MKRSHIWLVSLLIFAGLLFFLFSSNVSGYESLRSLDEEITIYKSSSCGCCGVYGNYFQRKGNKEAKVVNLETVDDIKKKYGVPEQLKSCHTTIIGDYFVEGHIPLEAIEKLLSEKPDIAGIAMPGMPNGSPGMPGTKRGDFVIYSVNHDGSFEEFMRL